MSLPPFSKGYETWAPVLARLILGGVMLFAAYGKIPWMAGFGMEAAYAAHAGVPFATAAVFLAFLLETAAGLMLVLGWHARIAALVLSPYILLLGLIFYHNFADQLTLGLFITHLEFIAGLLYISVYGARHLALRKD